MRDTKLVLEVLLQLEEAATRIINRFEPIKHVSDFTDSSVGIDKMDAICMRMIVIGEALKNLDKITEGKLLSRYPEVEWKKAKGMRDILTHHYADINAETVFFTCKRKIPQFLDTIRKIKKDLE